MKGEKIMYNYKKLRITKADIRSLGLWLKLKSYDRINKCGFQLPSQTKTN